MAKVGLDGHDRGVKVICAALRDAGVEVIYTGLHQTPARVAEAALQEDVDAVGISILSGAHMTLIPKVLEEMRKRGLKEVPLLVGGTIPPEDAEALKQMGVHDVVGPGTPLGEVVRLLWEAAAAFRQRRKEEHPSGR